MKHKILSIFILFCFTAPLTTTFVILQFQKYYVRRDVKRKIIAGMDKKELVLLKFTRREKEQLDWVHSREFEYKGRMYDVVEKVEEGDTIFYRCWEDIKETALNQKLEKLAASALGENPLNQENQKQLQTFFKSLYFAAFTTSEFPTTENITDISLFRAKIYQSLEYSPAVPPPEFPG